MYKWWIWTNQFYFASIYIYPFFPEFGYTEDSIYRKPQLSRENNLYIPVRVLLDKVFFLPEVLSVMIWLIDWLEKMVAFNILAGFFRTIHILSGNIHNQYVLWTIKHKTFLFQYTISFISSILFCLFYFVFTESLLTRLLIYLLLFWINHMNEIHSDWHSKEISNNIVSCQYYTNFFNAITTKKNYWLIVCPVHRFVSNNIFYPLKNNQEEIGLRLGSVTFSFMFFIHSYSFCLSCLSSDSCMYSPYFRYELDEQGRIAYANQSRVCNNRYMWGKKMNGISWLKKK